MLEDQRNGLKLSGHFQPATSLLSSPPSGSSFQPATLPALFRWLLYNTSLWRTAQHRAQPGQKSSPCAKKDYRNYLAPGERWVQFCLSVFRGFVFPEGQSNTFFIETRYPNTPHDPRSIWINTALNISVAELPAPLSTCCAASNKMPRLPKAASGESFWYAVVQCLAQQGRCCCPTNGQYEQPRQCVKPAESKRALRKRPTALEQAPQIRSA